MFTVRELSEVLSISPTAAHRLVSTPYPLRAVLSPTSTGGRRPRLFAAQAIVARLRERGREEDAAKIITATMESKESAA